MSLSLSLGLSITNQLSAGGGGGASFPAFAYQTETNTLASAFSVAPTTARKRTMDRAMRRLKTSGIYAKARWLRFQGANADASLTNWKVPSEKATAVGTPPFTADQHYAGNTGLNYINLGMNANVLAQNNLGMFVWYQTGHMNPTATQAGSTMGVINASSNGLSLVPNNASDMTIRCAGASFTPGFVTTNGFGLIGASRFNSTQVEAYYNGVKRATVANTSATLPALPVYLCGLNNNGSITNGNVVTQSFLYLGEALTETEVRNLTAIVGEYLETIRYGEYYCEEPGIGTGTISKQLIAYGLTGQSVNFAVQAARQGKTVAIIGGWRDRFSFGMAGGGLGYTDYDASAGLGGLPRWMITDCNTQEGTTDVASGTNPDAFKFNPKRFNRTCKALLAQYNIPVYLTNGVASVSKTGAAITSITTTDGRTVSASQWHDGTYEQDLIRLTAGIGWTKGREAAGSGVEANNGVRAVTTAAEPLNNASAVVIVDPWTTPGVTGSGLLPGIQTISSTFNPGLDNYPTPGSADTRLPAYNFRLTFTSAASIRVPLPSTPPSGFDAANFEVYLRWLDACVVSGSPVTIADIFKTDNLRSTSRYDLNKQGILSTNLVGVNHNYPTMTYAERETFWKLQWNHIMGLWYLLQYHADARVPGTLRTEALTWGMCSDHYYSQHENDEPFFNTQMYVREAIRLVGSVVMTGGNMAQTDGNVPTLGDHTVSVASYAMDSHSTQVVAHEKTAGVWQLRHEGGMFVAAGGVNLMAPLPYEIFVPKVAECTNVSCSFGASLTHVGYGSSRMEFTAMQTAQSMAIAAALAVDGDNIIQNVDYATLRTALLASPVLSGEVAPVLPQTT
jgi:hypothetical protein